MLARVHNWRLPQIEDENADFLRRKLDSWCDPLPTMRDFVAGMAHRNSNPKTLGQRWPPVRAIDPKRLHYRNALKQFLHGSGADAASGAGVFGRAYPNALLGDGRSALTPEAFAASKDISGIDSEAAKQGESADFRYVHHILEKHRGEARYWGAPAWLEVHSRVAHELYHKNFWHPQLARTQAARDYLVWWADTLGRDGGRYLARKHIDLVLSEEKGETSILKRAYDIHLVEKWYIRRGHYVTLPGLLLPHAVPDVPPTTRLRDEESAQRVAERGRHCQHECPALAPCRDGALGPARRAMVTALRCGAE